MGGDLEGASREELVQLIQSLAARIAALEARVVELIAEVERLRRENEALRSENEALRRQVEKGGGGKKEPPSWAKASRRPEEGPKEPRRKRAPEHNHGRRREEPTQIVRHALERCPQCQYRLRGESLHYSRQVIEIPPPTRVMVIEHQVVQRYCPHCRCWRSPKLDLRGQVMGQGRMGVRLATHIAYQRHTLRLPLAVIQQDLQASYQLRLSRGELVEVLHQVREAGQPAVEKLKGQVQASGIVHGDETGWRENGKNGYIWGFMTTEPTGAAVRYYEYDPSRAGAVAKRILGHNFAGHLVTDFYGGYNDLPCAHQRCWVHLLRDLHKLKEEHAPEGRVVKWARVVRSLYDQAQQWLEQNRGPTAAERRKLYVRQRGRAHRLGLLYAQVAGHPCQALAKRLLRHEEELFQFVLVPGLSADNNLAERGLRPLVVMRKISGGTRSDEGSKTRMVLASLFQTWQARGLNPLTECLQLLNEQTASPSQTTLPQS